MMTDMKMSANTFVAHIANAFLSYDNKFFKNKNFRRTEKQVQIFLKKKKKKNYKA